MGETRKFTADRDRAYGQILKAIGAHAALLPPALITDIRAYSPAHARTGAERESWRLYADGIRHLRNGAQGGKPGSLSDALARASIRNAALAAGLGIRPPHYENTEWTMPDLDTGTAEALFLSRRLLEAAESDLVLSRRFIASGLAAHNPAEAFGEVTWLSDDPELDKIARAARGKFATTVAPENLAAMRKQMVLCFNFLMDAYAEANKQLRRDIDAIH